MLPEITTPTPVAGIMNHKDEIDEKKIGKTK
jgi:hypothetical protein